MRYRTLYLVVGGGILGSAAAAQTSQLMCENWHPRLGQMNDIGVAIDAQQRTCNGNPCKITETELSWSEQGGRYEFVLNRLSGEGQIRLYGSTEPSTVLKNCRASEKKS